MEALKHLNLDQFSMLHFIKKRFYGRGTRPLEINLATLTMARRFRCSSIFPRFLAYLDLDFLEFKTSKMLANFFAWPPKKYEHSSRKRKIFCGSDVKF